MRRSLTLASLLGVAIALAGQARAQVFSFSTGDPDGKIATGARIPTPGNIQIETGDDFITTATGTLITHATFAGLLIGGSTVGDITDVNVDLYHVFPRDSDTVRTINVPTRVNSPADTEFDGRNFLAGSLSFTANVLSNSFTANNSVLNGIHPEPNQTTNGEGPVTGTEVLFDVTFTTPFLLPADHYFFVPTVALSGNGNLMWLSAPKPIVPPGTPFLPDLQAWIRDANLDPDWLRVGTDIVGPPPTGGPAPTFNMAFSLSGSAVPEPSSLAALGLGGFALAWRIRRLRRT